MWNQRVEPAWLPRRGSGHEGRQRQRPDGNGSPRARWAENSKTKDDGSEVWEPGGESLHLRSAHVYKSPGEFANGGGNRQRLPRGSRDRSEKKCFLTGKTRINGMAQDAAKGRNRPGLGAGGPAAIWANVA